MEFTRTVLFIFMVLDVFGHDNIKGFSWNFISIFSSSIIIIFWNFQLNFQFIAILHKDFNQDLAWGKFGMICILRSINCYLSAHIDFTLLKKWVTPQSKIRVLNIIQSWTTKYLFYVFICPFSDHTQVSRNYRPCDTFKGPHFRNFYVSTYLWLIF